MKAELIIIHIESKCIRTIGLTLILVDHDLRTAYNEDQLRVKLVAKAMRRRKAVGEDGGRVKGKCIFCIGFIIYIHKTSH